MATRGESAAFSHAVYHGDDAPSIPEGWELVDFKDEPNGYYAESYYNPETQELLVVNRGTEPTDLGDLQADIEICELNCPHKPWHIKVYG